jgi:sugar phosphate isomerase/epimerase
VTRFDLGINTCFAVKRWPEPERWAEVVRDVLGLDLVQHSLDLVHLDGPEALAARQAETVRAACDRFGLRLHSTFTGLAAYSSNLLLDPDPAARRWAEDWYERAIRFTAEVEGIGTGGHVGAFTVADHRDPARRRLLWGELKAALERLAASACETGLDVLYVENLAAAREPSTMGQIEDLITQGDEEHVPLALCLDVGHQVVPGTTGEERDPYAWLARLGARAPVVQLQQSDEHGDHHWPFTPETDTTGRIDPDHVLHVLSASGAEEVALILEVIPPFEQDDDAVLRDMSVSAERWRSALDRHAASR